MLIRHWDPSYRPPRRGYRSGTKVRSRRDLAVSHEIGEGRQSTPIFAVHRAEPNVASR